VFAIVLVLAVLLPSVVKLTHVFNHHKHEVCNEKFDTHFHQSDLECDFYKFKLTTQYYFKNNLIQMVSIETNFKITDSQYEFASNYQKLQTALRGPPRLI
jgi:hypothetical protein